MTHVPSRPHPRNRLMSASARRTLTLFALLIALSYLGTGCARDGRSAGSEEVYTIQWLSADVPQRLKASEKVIVPATLKNIGGQEISNRELAISYHWLDAADVKKVVSWDGMRTGVKEALAPGATLSAAVKIEAPAQPGKYVLALDMLRESVTWFSAKGAPQLRVEVTVE
jgi:hypothetical protein